MPRKAPGLTVDTSEAIAFTNAMGQLQYELNTTTHLNAVTQAAYEVLNEEFERQTHGVAMAAPEMFHHVYEWGSVGYPGFQLFRTRLNGRGGTRTITFDWLPSKSIVPVNENVEGGPRFRPAKNFNPDKLNPIHKFVWKAPMMEYGVNVTIRPKLSKVLVYPNANFGGPGEPVFTPHARRVDVSEQEGESVAGNFTTWFAGWFGGPQSRTVLDLSFSRKRDSAFRKSAENRLDAIGGSTGRMASKTFRIGADAEAARKGKMVARAIAGDLENHYIGEAAARKRRLLAE